MAKIFNTSEDTFFQISLLKDKSKEWLRYEIIIGARTSNQEKNLKNILKLATPHEQLFLEDYIEPEVPEVCAGLKKVIDNEISNFQFTPLDEKDFFLELNKIDEKYYLNVLSYEFNLFEKYDWKSTSMIGIRMEVNKAALEKFVAELQSEYEQIKSSAI